MRVVGGGAVGMRWALRSPVVGALLICGCVGGLDGSVPEGGPTDNDALDTDGSISSFLGEGNDGGASDAGTDGATPSMCKSSPEACGDGEDNDCDGSMDCDDPDCDGTSACVKQLVYVNFDGPVIQDCTGQPMYCSDARHNVSFAISDHFFKQTMDFAPYGGDGAKRADIVQRLRSIYAGYSIEFTTTRPASGNYMMVVISNSSGSNHGVSPLDCGNQNKNDIAFVYKIGSNSADLISRYAAHEIGHSFGLHHVTDRNAIMSWDSNGSAFRVGTLSVDNPCIPGGTKGTKQNAPAILSTTL
ncbi:MAG: matrixin family metalloprotease [Myxococcales bacterium]|nr:matrixin family metalloprotease [Myxococcales bacterium]